MRKVLAIAGVVVAVVVLLGALEFGDRDAIARAEAEAAHLAEQRDSLLAVAAGHRAQRDSLTAERTVHERTIAALRDAVEELEQDRARAQLSVRQLRTTGILLDRFRAAFTALGDSTVRLATVPLEPGDTLGIEYLMVPAWFAETFIIDHANAASWRRQRDGLVAVDSLRTAIAALQDSITRLALAEGEAYRAGYAAAYNAYGTLNTRYVAELRTPRLRLGSAFGFLLGAGTGIVVAELIR